MKLSWFSPLPPDHTDIGNYSARLLPSLSSSFDLKVFTETENWNDGLNKICPIQKFSAKNINWKVLNKSGLPVYHVGNNIHFHGDIISASRKCPGIIVLHDLCLHETILNLCLKNNGGRAGYFDILNRYGGKEAVDMGRAFIETDSVDVNELAVKYPLFEYVLENARGVITHNPLNADIIRDYTPTPVLYAPLPYRTVSELSPERKRINKSAEPYQILLFGFLGSSNRRLRPFMEALSKCPEIDRFHLTIAGTYPKDEVNKWIQELGLESRISLKDFVSDPELEELLESSDLCINLRWPSRGESSGTLLRIWNQSLPSIVTDTAFYSTLPRDAVAFVRPDHEEADILHHLSSFARDPAPYFEMGRAGRSHLALEHSAEAFVQHLQKFIPVVDTCRALPYAQMFGRDLVRKYLADYPDTNARSKLIQSCADEVSKWS